MSEVVVSTPRVSLNKLADYCVALAGERRRIITDQKNPPDFQVARYTMAEDAITEYLGGVIDATELRARRDEIEAMEPATEWQAERNASCVQAINAALAYLPHSPLVAYSMTPYEPESGYLLHEGVSISVRPNLIVEQAGRGRRGGRRGLLKLRFGKTGPMREEAGRFAGAILLRFAEEEVEGEAPAHHTLCMVYDVFHDAIHVAPRAVTRTWSHISAACSEYRIIWDAV